MKLTAAQWRILGELAEPNSNADNCWFFPQKNLRTLRSLESLGLAKAGEWNVHMYGFSITEYGRDRLREREDLTNV
ncbi:MAG TPA: hypothetical protein VK571_08740 [Gemmatimonadaceae bacterium]|nr:hypothetical protein [Gemmatimonadaceae bacterium]